MLKTIQKRMTVILIVSVLLKLFAGATPVLAEGSSDLITEPEFVPMLAVTLSPGEMTGAISVMVTDYVYGALFVNITKQEIATPRVGDLLPTAGENLFVDYEPGADITIGVAAGNYLQIYDVDMEEGARIVAFYQVALTAEDIKEEVVEKQVLDLEEESDSKVDEDIEDSQELDEDLSGDLIEGMEEQFENRLPDVGLVAEGGYIYIDEHGETRHTGDKTISKITDSAGTLVLNSGWYIVEGNVDRYWSIAVNGDVHLILADNSSLEIEGFFDAGINVSEGNNLTIYAQSTGDEMGVLNAMGHFYAAGIGGKEGNGGNITINGGTVIAKGGSSIGTGIGGGLKGSGGEITVNGGKVTAIGGTGCAGIGGSSYGHGGTVIINGGTVTAMGGNGGAGIGGGYGGDGGIIIVNNHPTVIATAGSGAADIGNGQTGDGATAIKHGSASGEDLTYIRLEIQNLLPNKTYSASFDEEEYAINSGGFTGFFIKRSIESRDVTIDPDGVLISINPGGVQNRKITISVKDYSDPVAGLGRALAFSSHARIDVPLNYNTTIGGSDFSLSMWVYPNADEPYQTLYRQYNVETGCLGMWLRYIRLNDNEGYLYFGLDARTYDGGWQWLWDWNNGMPPSDITRIPVHQWTHVALVKSRKSVILYANGVKYSEMTLDNTHYYASKPYDGNISIGGSSIDDQFFSGKMDEIRLWNAALTLDEIKAWMYRGIDKKHPKYDNLVFCYGFNESSGTIIIDSKEQNYGTMVNMTESNYTDSNIKDWSVEASSLLTGELAASHPMGTSNNGIDWNLTFEIVEQGKKGTAKITGDNKFEYCTRDANQEGNDSFSYRVKSPMYKYSNIETVNIIITPKINLNWPPNYDDSDRYDSLGKEDSDMPVIVTGNMPDTIKTSIKDGKRVVSIAADDKRILKELEQQGRNAVVTISNTGDADIVVGTVSGKIVKNMKDKDAVLEIKTGWVTYTLPASQINIDAVSEQIGKQAELKDITVSVKISEPAADTVKIVEDTADKNNYQIIVRPIEFEISCSCGSKTVEVTKFNAYVERMIAMPDGVDPSKIMTGVILNADGTFSHVPTVITMIDGKYYAKIKSLTNSTYSIIYSPKTFKDVEGHWAERDINDMASRLIISGTGNDLFEPWRSITRAEFSAVMVRALGLRPETCKDDYFDVKRCEWYYEYISTASYHSLISGYDDGTFKPDGKINRQEAMAIIARAMDITKLGEGLEVDARKILAVFDDNADVSDWARDLISKCVRTGIVIGRDNGRIAPRDNITRAEAVNMVHKLLSNSDLVN